MTKLILASKSPRRQKILKDHGFKFSVIPADIDEEKYTNLPPLQMVKKLSFLKAEKISKEHKKAIVLGSDTTVVLKKENIGKPKDLKEAKTILTKLSGSTHLVHTGFTIIDPANNKKVTSSETTKLKFKKISEKDIDKYIKSHNVLDFAGSYAIQEGARGFVKNTEGDYLNILGLPTKAIKELEKVIK